jgi:hypothetical protein
MAYFVHRTTKELEISVGTPSTPVEDNIRNPDLTGLYDLTTRTYLVEKKYWEITGDVISEMSQAEKDVVDASDEYVIPARQKKFDAIDARTDELIGQGFTWSSAQFSNSLFGQSKVDGAYAAKDLTEFTYPIVWNSMDNMTTVSIPDAATMQQFFLAALGTIRAHLDSATPLKDQVRAASTVQAVEAVVDTR